MGFGEKYVIEKGWVVEERMGVGGVEGVFLKEVGVFVEGYDVGDWVF